MGKILGSLAAMIILFFSTVAVDALEVKPTGRIYTHFNYNLSGYPDWDSRSAENDFAEFALERAYLGVSAKFSDQWSALVVGDISRLDEQEVTPIYEEETDDNGDTTLQLVDVEVKKKKGSYGYYVKYAYGQYQPFEALGFRLGSSPTPFIDQYEKAWGYRYVEKTPSDRVKWDSSADLGLVVYGDLPKGLGSYYTMIRNGEGYKKPEIDSGKAGQVRLLLTPLQMHEAVKNLQLTAAYRFEKEERQDPDVANHMVNLLLSYKYKFFQDWGVNFGAGYDWKLEKSDQDDADDITGMIVHGYAVFYFPHKLALFGRLDWYDPDIENDKDSHGYRDETTYVLGGLSIDPIKNIALAVDVKHMIYNTEIGNDKDRLENMHPDTNLYMHANFKF